MNFFAGYLITFFVDIKNVYSNLNLPTWAPATWVFGFAWTINNILVLYGNIKTLNLPTSKDRTNLVRLQILSWINYSVFQWISFGTGIPQMFFWPTFSMLILTVFSIFYAYKLDKKNGTYIYLSFSTLLIWLILASTLGFFIMTNN